MKSAAIGCTFHSHSLHRPHPCRGPIRPIVHGDHGWGPWLMKSAAMIARDLNGCAFHSHGLPSSDSSASVIVQGGLKDQSLFMAGGGSGSKVGGIKIF